MFKNAQFACEGCMRFCLCVFAWVSSYIRVCMYARTCICTNTPMHKMIVFLRMYAYRIHLKPHECTLNIYTTEYSLTHVHIYTAGIAPY